MAELRLTTPPPRESTPLLAVDAIAYFSAPGRLPPLLTPLQEGRLGRTARRADAVAAARTGARAARAAAVARAVRARLAAHNVRLVINVARAFAGRGLDLDDLIGYGCAGLQRAVLGFDPDCGRLTTYATWWIRQEICRALVNYAALVRIPAYLAAPTAAARRNGALPVGANGYAAAALACATRLVVPGGAGAGVINLAAPPSAEVIADERLAAALAHLPPRTARVVRARFGLDADGPLSLRVLAVELGLTKERVRQIERDGLRRLRKALGDDDRA